MSRDRALFVAAAAYDLVLGAAFFFLYGPMFGALGIALPTNTSYIHISAGFVFVQGIGYAFVARDLARNHDIVRLGVVYKAMYIGVAVYETLIGQLLSAVFLWFAAFDLLFLVLFLEFLRRAGPPRGA